MSQNIYLVRCPVLTLVGVNRSSALVRRFDVVRSGRQESRVLMNLHDIGAMTRHDERGH